MKEDDAVNPVRELHELNGAIEVLWELREEFAQWAEEAQDDSKQEALENVLGHMDAVLEQYKLRSEGARKRLAKG